CICKRRSGCSFMCRELYLQSYMVIIDADSDHFRKTPANGSFSFRKRRIASKSKVEDHREGRRFPKRQIHAFLRAEMINYPVELRFGCYKMRNPCSLIPCHCLISGRDEGFSTPLLRPDLRQRKCQANACN